MSLSTFSLNSIKTERDKQNLYSYNIQLFCNAYLRIVFKIFVKTRINYFCTNT